MPRAARIGDIGACAVHGPNSLATGSPNVKINGIPAHRISDSWSCGAAQAEGSPNVRVNRLPLGRIGDQGDHGGPVATGSPNVYVNDGRRVRA